MKTKLLLSAALVALSSAAFASGSHDGGHDEDTTKTETESHDDGHDHGHDSEKMAVGIPGEAGSQTRTIEVSMRETDDGAMIFVPANLDIKTGEIVLFNVVNKGELEHEFVLDTVEENQKHKAVMAKFPDMEHDDPNSIRLAVGETGQIVWNFSNCGTFEFACLIPGHYESGMHGGVLVADTLPTYTKGFIKRVTKSGKVTVKHEELVDLGMPAMTMVFRVADEAMLDQLSEGQDIEFHVDRIKGKLTITKLK